MLHDVAQYRSRQFDVNRHRRRKTRAFEQIAVTKGGELRIKTELPGRVDRMQVDQIPGQEQPKRRTSCSQQARGMTNEGVDEI
jgi:hypothetical protein